MSKLIIGALIAIVVACADVPVFAHEERAHPSNTRGSHEERSKDHRDSERRLERAAESSDSKQAIPERGDKAERRKSHAEQKELRRSELKQQIESKKNEHKERLADKRLETCQKRQTKINALIQESGQFGRQKLTRIQAVEAQVKEFYVREALSSSEYETATRLVDEKEARADAAVSIAESQSFDCNQVDGLAPSSEIKLLREARNTALEEYRSSLKQLVQIVKAALVNQYGKNKDAV